jgi:hypothetical protein
VISAPLQIRRVSPENIGGNVSTTPNDTTAQSQKTWTDTKLTDDIYDAWRSACQLVDAAYRAWSQAARGEARGNAYLAYAANLYQEEAAARHLRSSIETPQAQPETWPCLSIQPAIDPAGKRWVATSPAVSVAPPEGESWARLLAPGARAPQAGPARRGPTLDDPRR